MKKISLNTNTFFYFSTLGLELKYVAGEKKNDESRYLGNFIPVISRYVRVRDEKGISHWIEFNVEFANGLISGPFQIPLAKLEKIKWSEEIDDRCIINPEVPKVKDYIMNLIRLQCSEKKSEEVIEMICEPGGKKVEENFVFHAGNKLIWPDKVMIQDRDKVFFRPKKDKVLIVKEECGAKEADKAMEKILQVSEESGQILFAFNLSCILWSAFEEMGIVPKCIVYLYGPSGVGKTTYASFVTQIFNRDKNLKRPERFNASIPAIIELMKEVREGVLLLDDLYPAHDLDMLKKQEKVFLEITRIIGDGVYPSRMKGGRVNQGAPRCGILCTGEYYLGKGSDAARMLPIEVTSPIIGSELWIECQNEPLLLSTFYSYFLQWYVDKYEEIVTLMKGWKLDYLREVANNNRVHLRLREIQFCLEIAYRIYILYRNDMEFISEEDGIRDYEEFYNRLDYLVNKQNERIHNKSGNRLFRVDYVKIISKIFYNKEFQLVKKPRKFILGVHDGICYKNRLYFRRDRLLKKISAYDPQVSWDEVISYLKEEQMLEIGTDNTAKQLCGAGKGLRFYAIKMEKLNRE